MVNQSCYSYSDQHIIHRNSQLQLCALSTKFACADAKPRNMRKIITKNQKFEKQRTFFNVSIIGYLYHWNAWKLHLIVETDNLSRLGVCRIAFQSLYGSERNTKKSSESEQFRSESKFVCVVHGTKHCELCELQAASIVGFFGSPPWTKFFWNFKLFGIPTSSELQK